MSLVLGMLAALAWGIHDLCVRRVSQDGGVFAPLVTVFAIGCIFVVPVSIVTWPDAIDHSNLKLSAGSGVVFGLAVIALYMAFSIGPVRLVAPIIGAYPILSVGWAVLRGSPVGMLDIVAVGIVIAGAGYVAASADTGEGTSSRMRAVLWSVAAGAGFAVAFALGQNAAETGEELALLGPTRVAALVTVILCALVVRAPMKPKRSLLPLFAAMGVLDAVALSLVISSGGLPHPEYAPVAASTFGLITVILATVFLRERITPPQLLAVACVFGAIAYLGL